MNMGTSFQPLSTLDEPEHVEVSTKSAGPTLWLDTRSASESRRDQLKSVM